MSELAAILEAFHFLRPIWLLMLPVIGLIWFRVRRRVGATEADTSGLAPHLRAALTVGAAGRRRVMPVDGVALVLGLAVLGAAGPTWSRVPDPFVAQTAPLVIALEVTPSMTADDVAPTRLDRARQKIRDLLDLRAGARTALVAYAGTAHAVVPMTDDPAVVTPYLEGLSPEVMPEEGADAAAALALAQQIIAKEDAPGGILFVLDGIEPADLADFKPAGGASLAALAMLPEGVADRGLDGFPAPVVRVTPDDADIARLDRALSAAYRRALTEEGTQPWDDRGWLLAWPAAVLALLWFRRGWTMRWGAVLAVAISAGQPGAARADGVADWFLTPDQQGYLAYQRKDFDRAAELFADPMWKGRALYRDGRYAEAAKVYGRLETAEAAFAQGLAHIKGREYREGIAAFETALRRDPDHPGAAENLATARQILDYVETAREQSDTGEERGIGADDVVFDNEDARGAETQVEREGEGERLLSAEQWMNTIDTDTGAFLRQRFAVEAAARK